MPDPVVENLILDLLEWLTNGERTYEEVMNAWRTSCPRLPVWEDANDRGLIASEHVNGHNLVRVSHSVALSWTGAGRFGGIKRHRRTNLP